MPFISKTLSSTNSADISLLLRQDYLVNQVVETKRNQAFFVCVKVRNPSFVIFLSISLLSYLHSKTAATVIL